jgi:hypothetical protein
VERDEEEEQQVGGLAKARYCSDCASWRVETPCPTCGADLLEEGEAPDAPDVVAVGPTRSEFTLRLAREVLPAIPGAIICAFLVAAALLSQALLPFGELHWPGKIVAGFVACTWLLERARSARSQGSAIDIVAIGGVLLRALYLLPVLLGILTLHWAAIPASLLLALAGPLFLAALAGEEPLSDLSPRALLAAYSATDGYARYAALTTLGLAALLVPLGLDGEDPLWRAAVIGLGAALAGTAAGLARRSAERTPEA